MMTYIALILIAAAGLTFLVLWLNAVRGAKELAGKTGRSVNLEPALPVELDQSGALNQIADNFNQLVMKTQEYAVGSKQLKVVQKEKESIEKKFIQSERSTQGIRLFTEMGRQITKSLSIDEITESLFNQINSACSLDEIEIFLHDSNKIYSKDHVNQVKTTSAKIADDSIQNWVLKQHRIAVLDNNERDHTRYCSAPVRTLHGGIPVSVICVELNLGEKNIGTFTIASKHESVFEDDMVDYIHSLASYAAIAIDNALVYTDLGKQKELLEVEKAKADRLLLNILPRETAEELKETGKARARRYDNVSVIFSDFKSFTKIAEAVSPEELVAELDECFSAFDDISLKYNLEKIKTIGDAYLAVCGLPVPVHNHAEMVVRAGLEMQEYLTKKNIEREANSKPLFYARIGIHSGPVVAGVVGKSKFAFDIWGDTVNTAARMEQSGEIEKVNLSGVTWNLVDKLFKGTYRGKIEAKNKGTLDMYFAEHL